VKNYNRTGCGKAMRRNCEMTSNGVRLLLSNHRSIRKLKKDYIPSDHGYKVWPTTWLLIDYLKRDRLIAGQSVLDIACGWGLSGIFCAKRFNSKVTWIDGDEEVYPYLRLMGEINKIKINFIHRDINRVRRSILQNIDVIIGSDICFCDTLIDPIRKFIDRAKKASVAQVYIADPGRWPFDELADLFIRKREAELLDWQTTKPTSVQGRILKFSF
jgi:SAM-dependent methyltransferase